MIAVYPLYPTKNIHSKPIFIGIPSRSWGTTQVAHWCIPISLLDTPWIDDDTFLLSTIHWYPQFYCLYRHWWVNLPSSWLLPLISPHIVQNLCWLLVTLGLYYHILSSILKKKTSSMTWESRSSEARRKKESSERLRCRRGFWGGKDLERIGDYVILLLCMVWFTIWDNKVLSNMVVVTIHAIRC